MRMEHQVLSLVPSGAMDYLGNDVAPAGRARRTLLTTLLGAVAGLLLLVDVVGAFTVSGGGGRYPSGQPASVVAAAADGVATSGPVHVEMVTTIHAQRTVVLRVTGEVDKTRQVGRIVVDRDRAVL